MKKYVVQISLSGDDRWTDYSAPLDTMHKAEQLAHSLFDNLVECRIVLRGDEVIENFYVGR